MRIHVGRIICGAFVLSLELCLLTLASLAQRRILIAQPVEDLEQELISAGRYHEAVDLYRRTLAAHPEWTAGWWKLGTTAYDAGDFKISRSSLNEYLTRRPQDTSARALKGLAEFELGFNAESLADLRRADRAGITAAGGLRSVANLHELLLLNSTGNFDGAFKMLQRLSSDGCSSPLLIQGAGLTALRRAALPATLPEQEQLLVSQTGLAVCNAAADRWNLAHDQFASLIEHYPRQPQLHYLYGCFLLKDHPDEGLSQLQAELELSNDHAPAMAQVALEYLRRGEPSTALPFAQRAVEIAPQGAQAQYAFGKALIELHQVQSGIRHLRIAKQLSPNDRNVLWALAAAYGDAGMKGAASDVRREMANLDMAATQP